MSFEGAIGFFIAIFIFGITPGPGIFAILAKAMTQGGRRCFSLSLGMAISDMCYLIFACLGLAVIAENWSGLFLAIRIIGAAYLIYLGYKMWRAPAIAVQQSEPQTGDALASFIQGFLISASNPKVILFYIAFLPSLLDIASLTASDIVLASVLTVIALMLGLMLIAYGVGWARKMFQSERASQRLNRTAGSIMIAAGAYLVARH